MFIPKCLISQDRDFSVQKQALITQKAPSELKFEVEKNHEDNDAQECQVD